MFHLDFLLNNIDLLVIISYILITTIKGYNIMGKALPDSNTIHTYPIGFTIDFRDRVQHSDNDISKHLRSKKRMI